MPRAIEGTEWSSQPQIRKKGSYAGDFLLATNILLSGNNYAKVALLFRFMHMSMVSRTQFERVQALYVVCMLMDCESKSIVSILTVDKRETGLKSVNMEKLGLQRSLDSSYRPAADCRTGDGRTCPDCCFCQ